ncbi:unnamed protein product [Peronospora belbahrii]|uniref:WW domain-containing protein n=1 Tax=Peronospora belbahrii TaxID=622444 RepID=A0ABN8DDK0_9STRA|nr:unnamed protein product [Peronospora belbahrii]
MVDSHEEYSTIEYSSPKKQVAGHVSVINAPSIDTNMKEILPPSSPASGNIVCGLSTSSIGSPFLLKLKTNQQSLSGDKSEKRWKKFIQLLQTNEQTLDMIDAQLAAIWAELVLNNEQVTGCQALVDTLSQIASQLLLQKREAAIAIAKLVEVLGSRVFLSGKMTDDAVAFVSNQLRLELETSQVLVDRVKSEMTACRKGSEVVGLGKNRINALLRQQLQENEQLLQTSRAAVANLKDQLTLQKQISGNIQTQLERVLEVKLREIDAMCSDVDLPTDYERIKTVEGVVCYRRKGSDDSYEIEDPRVHIALKMRSVRPLATASARAFDREAISAHYGNASSGKIHRFRGVSVIARDSAARDNVICRSFSTPHIPHDSNVLDDALVPPDDGRKHAIQDFSTPLPDGWEMRVTLSGAVFFFNKHTTATTWTDPRLLDSVSTSFSADYNSSHPMPLSRDLRATTSESRPSISVSNTLNSEQLASKQGKDGVQFIDVVFEDCGPIGIHFQANVPDSGATVRSLLPDMAAAKMNILEPYDELVAVNKNSVDSAPFRHVMLLLQGGLRPLTLTFKRDLKCLRRSMSPIRASQSSDVVAVVVGGNDIPDTTHPDEDEEVVIDEGTVVDLEQLRVPIATGHISTASGANDGEGMNVADVIITNIFSLFWKPPETTGEEVETV